AALKAAKARGKRLGNPQVEEIYASNRFWPEPLISSNPHFERGASVDDLAADGTLHPDTARVFRVDGHPIRFHRHQAQAIAKAVRRQSFAVTTGTARRAELDDIRAIILRPVDHDPVPARHRHFFLPQSSSASPPGIAGHPRPG